MLGVRHLPGGVLALTAKQIACRLAEHRRDPFWLWGHCKLADTYYGTPEHMHESPSRPGLDTGFWYCWYCEDFVCRFCGAAPDKEEAHE